MSMDSSQGMTFGSISGLTNVKVSKKSADPTDSSNRLDASTLELDDGDDRVYVDGLPDPGAGAVDGLEITVSVSFLSDTPPEAGDEVEYGGQTLVCTESEVEYAVGELVKGTASYKTKPPVES
jgi:hypothetical protein